MSVLWVVRPAAEPKLNVVMVHGLGGHPYETWKAGVEAPFWPEWLAEDFPGLAVATLAYPAYPSWFYGASMSLDNISDNIRDNLPHAINNLAPIVFICHSLGGIVCKKLLIDMADTYKANKMQLDFSGRTRGVMYFATPHSGAFKADLLTWFRFLFWPTPIVNYLTRHGFMIGPLNQRYVEWSSRVGLIHYTCRELLSVFPIGRIVQEYDATLNMPGANNLSMNYDHGAICKPNLRDDERYLRVKRFIDQVARENNVEFDNSAIDTEVTYHQTKAIKPSQAPVIARVAITGFAIYLMIKSVMGVKADFEYYLLAELEARGATEGQVGVLTDKVEQAWRSEDIRKYFLKYNQAPEVKNSTSPDEYAQKMIELARQIASIHRQIEEIKQSKDQEVRSYAPTAVDAIAAGNLRKANRAVEAAKLRDLLLSEVKYLVQGDKISFLNDWAQQNIVAVDIPELGDVPNFMGTKSSRVYIYQGVAGQLTLAMREIANQGLLPAIKEFCGTLSDRTLRGSRIISPHALGIAIDFNCSSMPRGRSLKLNATDAFGQVIAIMDKYGFAWGGTYSFPDPMHFQAYEARDLPFDRKGYWRPSANPEPPQGNDSVLPQPE